MAYRYNGSKTIEAEAARQQQLKAELDEARAAYREAVKLRKANERLEAEILRTKQRAADLSKPFPKLPEPVHGGPLGLLRATHEIEAHNKRKKQVA